MSRLEFSAMERRKLARAEQLEEKAKKLRGEASESRKQRDLKRPAFDRLVYAAASRCACGYGMAYDPTGKLTASPDRIPSSRPHSWECAGTLLYRANELSDDQRSFVKEALHDSPLPFTFYEIKSESQPSAHGATTREPIARQGAPS